MNAKSKLTTTLSAIVLAGAAFAQANEMLISAEVTSVETLTAPATRIEICPPKPESGAKLSDTLAWDLGLHCHVEQQNSNEIVGYRVHYQWDNRSYSRVMSSPPGETLALKVRLN